MSLRPQGQYSILEETQCVARAVFPKGDLSPPWSRFSFRDAYGEGGFNLFLEIVGAKHAIRLGGSPEALE
jgi:hypothetical protein